MPGQREVPTHRQGEEAADDKRRQTFQAKEMPQTYGNYGSQRSFTLQHDDGYYLQPKGASKETNE